MTGPSEVEKLVSADGVSVQKVFEGKAYYLGYFQRSYVWRKVQVERLVEDLAGKFKPQWKPTLNKADVESYKTYFLGSIIIYREDDRTYLADGQQRVITLLLLLILLHDLTKDREDSEDERATLRTLIRGGSNSDFAVRAPTYRACFTSLLNGQEFSTDGSGTDVRRVWEAAQNMAGCVPDELSGEALPDFVRWLLSRVSLVEIDAGGSVRGKELFALMNDRGVRLSPLDHLKDYLLDKAPEDQADLGGRWQSMVNLLQSTDPNGPLEFVRTFLRARYFDVGSDELAAKLQRDDAPHEWLHENEESIWPRRKVGDQSLLFTDWLEPCFRWYAELLGASTEFRRDWQTVWLNTHNNLLRQFDLTLAAVNQKDSRSTALNKARLVANFIDLFVVSRGLADESYAQADLDAVVRPLLPQLREAGTQDDVARVLGAASREWFQCFSKVGELRYRESVNRPFVLYFLARLTAWVDERIGGEERLPRLLTRPQGRRPFEVEHLFTKRAGVYVTENLSDTEIQQQRGRLGALILLDGIENASLGALPLRDKVEKYPRYNWLAASLHPDSYKGRGVAGFRKFLRESNLEGMFRHYRDGEPIDQLIDHRSRLYEEIARRIWSAETLGLNIEGDQRQPVRPDPASKSSLRATKLTDLLHSGFVKPDAVLVGTRSGTTHRATLLSNGKIRTAYGTYDSLSKAERMVLDSKSANGWKFWRVESSNQSLDAIRSRYLASPRGRGPSSGS